MGFKEIWRPRIDGVDIADSSAVNEIAEAVIKNETNLNELVSLDLPNFISVTEVAINYLDGQVTKLISDVGNIDTALDSIIAIQESLIGGDS